MRSAFLSQAGGTGLEGGPVSLFSCCPLGLPGPGRTGGCPAAAPGQRSPHLEELAHRRSHRCLTGQACVLGVLTCGVGRTAGVFSPAPLCPGPCPRVLSEVSSVPSVPGGGRRGAFLLREWHTGQGRVCTTAL